MNQRWLWNFPEGPCSPRCSPSDCQSLTSTAAAIGWRANRVEHYWSAVLCHTDHSVQAPLFLLKSIFAAMQRFPPALDGLYSFTLACPSWLWQYKPEGTLRRKGPFGRLYPWVVMHNSTILPSCLYAALPEKEVTTPWCYALLAFLTMKCSIYITGSVMQGEVTHYYPEINFWFWFYRESDLTVM